VFIRHIFLCDLYVILANSAVKRGFAGISMVHVRDLTSEVIGAAIQIHRKLGPGLLESAYEACLAYELQKLRLYVERQRPVPLVYEAVKLDCGFRADLVVENRLVVECKCKELLHPVDEAQLLSHLRLLNIPVGLLINFHVVLLKDGIKRMVNNYREPPEMDL
jgi:GxxExxY protein